MWVVADITRRPSAKAAVFVDVFLRGFPAAEEIDECCNVSEAFLFATGVVGTVGRSDLEDGV